ncbi:MAG TPA: hypothetical protein VIV65_11920 [Gemmatimonadaceae bacterium]|jgi:hypothetical protein
MRRISVVAAIVACVAMPLAAQKKPDPAPKQAGKSAAIKVPAAAVGTWSATTVTGPKDSVVTTSTFTLKADGSGTEILPDRDPITNTVVAAGGDSLVIESSRFKSILRPKLTVVTRTTFHLKGNTMSGTTHASYSDGSKLDLKTTATKKK